MLLEEKLNNLRQKGLNYWQITNAMKEFNYSEDGLTPLMIAVIANNSSLVDIIISNYTLLFEGQIINVNSIDKQGKTAMDYATSPRIIELLKYSGGVKSSQLANFYEPFSYY